MNETVLYDISVKKGRRDKFTNHMNKIQSVKNNLNLVAKRFRNKSTEFQSRSKKLSLWENQYNLLQSGEIGVKLNSVGNSYFATGAFWK